MNCEITITDKDTGVILNFPSEAALKNYLNEKEKSSNENSLEIKLEELRKDTTKKQELSNVLNKIGELYRNLKMVFPEINKLAEEYPAIKAAMNSIRNIDDARFKEIINQSKFVFVTIQEYKVLGEHLESIAKNLRIDLNNGKISLNDTYHQLRNIQDYYMSINKISSSLEEYVRDFIKDSKEPIFDEFKGVQNHFDTIRSITKDLSSLYYKQYLASELPEDANKDLDEEIRTKTVERDRLISRGKQERADILTQDIENLIERRITPEYIEKALKSGGGKSNQASNLLEDLARNSNIVLSTFRKKLEKLIFKARDKTMQLVNEPITKAWNEFKTKTNRDPSNSKVFNKNLYEIVERFKFDEETNSIIGERFIELNKPWDMSALSKDEAEWEQKIFNATTETEKKNLQRDYTNWERENKQQEFNDEILKIKELLIPEAKQILDDYNTKISIQLDELNKVYTDEGDRSLALLIIEKNALGYKNYKNGKLKEGIDLKIAESIKAYREAWADVYEEYTSEDELNAEEKKERSRNVFKLTIEKLKNDIGYEGDSKKLIDNKEKRWKLSNERRVINLSFFDKRKEISDKIKDVKQKLGQSILKSEKEELLWKEIFEISSSYRNKDRIIQGQYLSNEEILKIKDLESQIEHERETSKNSIGITELEIKELNRLIGKYNAEKYEKIKGTYASYLRGLQIYSLPNTPLTERDSNYERDLDFIKSYEEKYKTGLKDRENKKMLLTEEEIMEKVELQKTLSALYEELYTIQQSEYTENYYQKYDQELANFINHYALQGIEVSKVEFENLNSNEYNNDWYKNNHRVVERWDPILGKTFQIKEPIYVWKEILPTDESLITVKPAYHFYESRIKEKYRNKNQELDPFYNEPLPNRNGKYDKKEKFNLSPDENKALSFLTQQYASYQNMTKENFLRPGYKVMGGEKSFADRFIEGQYSPKKLVEGVKRIFSTTELDNEEGIGVKKETYDKLFNVLPLKGTTNVKDLDNASFDIWGSISKFGEYSIMRNEFSNEFANAQELYNIVKGEDLDLHLEENNKNSWSILQGLKSIKDKNDNTAKALEQMIRTLFFNELRNNEEKGVFNFQKIVGGANKIAAFTTLAWAVPSQIVNFLSAKVQVLIQTHGGELINWKDYLKGGKEYRKRSYHYFQDLMNQRVAEMSIETKVGLKWGFIQGQHSELSHQGYNKNRIKQFVTSGLGGNFLREIGDHQVQTQVGLSILEKNVVSVKDSKNNLRLISLLELYEELARNYNIYRIDELLESPYAKDYIFENWSQIKEDELRMKMFDLNQTINGLYDQLHKTIIEKGSLGAALFFFRKYLVPMVTERFEGYSDTRYNLVRNRSRRGQYITLYDKVLKPLMKGRMTELQDTLKEIVKKNPEGTLTERDRENFRKLSAEFGIIITLGLLIMAIGDDKEDIDEHSFFTLYALYFAKKVKSESEQFIPLPPFGWNELSNTLKSPSIAFNQLANYNRLYNDLVYHITGNEKAYYQNDTVGFWEKGDSKVLRDVLALSVGFKGSTFYPEQLIKNFEYAQRNR